VILRPAEYSDRQWITAAYADWPNPKDFISEERVHRLLRRWIERGDVVCRVAMVDDVPVGLITYRCEFFGAWIYNVLIVPGERQRGYFKEMARLVRDDLVSNGVMIAGFKPLPGTVIDRRYPDDQFRWDMDV
jgi:hypothetical protein